MVIKHLVLSGGGPTGFLTYGAARFLSKEGFWDISNIESIYGCSIGAFMGVVFTLGYEWEWLDDYFVKRPWDKIVDISITDIFKVYEKKGILDITFVEKAIGPLLTAKDIDMDITLKDFYDHTQIEFHLFSMDINTEEITKIDLSYKTHPNLSLVKAIYMSMSFPSFFQPICEDGHCYIDGGLCTNYPLQDCINQTECKEDEILAFKNEWGNFYNKHIVSNESTLIDFILVLMRKMQRAIDSEPHQINIKNTVRCLLEGADVIEYESWVETLNNETKRAKLISLGSEQGKIFYSYHTSQGSVEELSESV